MKTIDLSEHKKISTKKLKKIIVDEIKYHTDCIREYDRQNNNDMTEYHYFGAMRILDFASYTLHAFTNDEATYLEHKIDQAYLSELKSERLETND